MNISTIVKNLESEVRENSSNCDLAVMHGQLNGSYDYIIHLSDGRMYYCEKEYNKNRLEGFRNIINFSVNKG